MHTSDIILFTGVTLVVTLIITYHIIRLGVKNGTREGLNKVIRQLKIQNDLLKEMAINSGVEEKTVSEIEEDFATND